MILDQVQTPAAQAAADRWLLKATLLAASILTVMSGAVIAPALPAIRAHFADADPLLIQLVLTIPALFIAVGGPIAGYIVDKLGRKRLLVLGVLLYGIAGASSYLTNALELILIERALLGVAVAVLMTSVITLIADYYSGLQRSRFLGLQTAVMGLGGTLFVSLGGVLADVDWHAPFLIYLLAFVVLPFTIVALHEPPRVSTRLAETSASGPAPRAPIRLMVFVYFIVVLIQIIFSLSPLQLPFYLQTLVGAQGTQSGLAVAGMSLSFALSSAMFGWINRRFAHLPVLVAGLLLTSLGFLALSLAADWTLIVVGLVLSGFGIGLIMPNMNVWLTNQTPPAIRGRVLGGFMTSVFLGQFLSPIVSLPVERALGTAAVFASASAVLTPLAIIIVVFMLRGRAPANRSGVPAPLG